MHAFMQRGFRAFLVTSLTLSLGFGPVGADTLKQKISAAEEDVTAATQEVLTARASLIQAQRKLPAARAALANANREEATARAKYATASANLSDAKQQLKDARGAIVIIQEKIKELQSEVDQFARSVYQQGPASQLEIVLESESPTDLSSRLQAIKSVARASSASLTHLNTAKSALKVQVVKAKRLTNKMQGLATAAASTLAADKAATAQAYSAQAEVDALVIQEHHALAIAKAFKAQAQRKYERLIAEQIEINRRSNSGSHGDGDPAGTSGLIPQWPVPGYAAGSDPVQHVGPRILSDGRHSCHTGQDIPAPTGADIVSPGPGVVLFAGWNWGYGNLTLIDHGDGLVTVFAHQSRILVSKGDLVTTGEHIGDVGNTGAFSRGAHLHFEVHLNGFNYDPMGWYGGSKTIVACAPTRGF